MLSEQEMAEIRQRADRATPGPWADLSTPDEVRPIISVATVSEICHDPDLDDRESDRAFIAAARTDVPRLLDALVEAYSLLARFAHDSDAFQLGRQVERKALADVILHESVVLRRAINRQPYSPTTMATATSFADRLVRMAEVLIESGAAAMPGVWPANPPSPDTHVPSS